MLALRPGCELCDRDLPADQPAAYICSFECTFCHDCASRLAMCCPNCGGELLPRPRRVGARLVANPASTQRVYKPRQL